MPPRATPAPPVRHPGPVANRWEKPLRILVGIVLMGLFVTASLFVVTRYAGGWGGCSTAYIPYGWTWYRGTSC